MKAEKILMRDAAILYYEKNKTQQEIAQALGLSRQTVSRLLSGAVEEKVVEITIHDPEGDRGELERRVCQTYAIRNCVVCAVTGKDEGLHRLGAVRAAVDYLLPKLKRGGLNVAVSWGRTIQEWIGALPETPTDGNVVFPLFGATDNGNSYFSSNELARSLADKLGAVPKCAWFPYLPEHDADRGLLKQLSYYKTMQRMWDTADLAVLGIGNTEILEVFGRTFGYSRIHDRAIGDVATHFFDEKGGFLNLYENTLCASVENLKNAKETVAIACGKEKAAAIAGALRTGVIDTLITDEHTARRILENK